MHGVAPQMCGGIGSPLSDRGAGGRTPGYLLGGDQNPVPSRRSTTPFPPAQPSKSRDVNFAVKAPILEGRQHRLRSLLLGA